MAYTSNYKSPSTGKAYAVTPGEARGNWEREYLSPETSQQRATELYGTYGSRYGWQPLTERFAPAPAPQPAAPVAPAGPTPEQQAQQQAQQQFNQQAMFPGISGQLPAAPTAPQAPQLNMTVPTAPTNLQAPEFGAAPQAPSLRVTDQLGSIESYLPSSIEASPFYQWQLQQQEKILGQRAAARGYQDSGLEEQLYSDAVSRLTAEESQRQWERAKAEAESRRLGLTTDVNANTADYLAAIEAQDAQRKAYETALTGWETTQLNPWREANQALVDQYASQIKGFEAQMTPWVTAQEIAQTEAERYRAMAESEARRQAELSNTQWGRAYDMLGLLLNQSPMTQAYAGTQDLSGLYANMGQQLAGYMSGGGGGGGYVPPPAYTGPTPVDIQAAGAPSTSQNWLTLLGSLFGETKKKPEEA